MKNQQFLYKRLTPLVAGVLFLGFQASASIAPSPEAGDRTACARKISFRGKYDKTEGLDRLALLHEINAELETHRVLGTLTAELVLSKGYAVWVEGEVKDKVGQKVPYKRLNLPFAHTGINVPLGQTYKFLDPTLFDARAILLPGIGFEVSTAPSMFTLAGTLKKGSNPGLQVRPKKSLRILGFPMDPPLNGMGEDAPYGFGHPEGVIAVIRHADLILLALMPEYEKRGIMGRSQGALNAIKYAADYGDFDFAVALNPSSTDQRIIDHCIEFHEFLCDPANAEIARAQNFDVRVHTKSWTAHADYTPLYAEALARPSKVRVLLQLGLKDTSYLQPLYRELWEEWARNGVGMRSVQIYDGGHNLWIGKDYQPRGLFDEVMAGLGDFIAPLILDVEP